MGKFSVLAITVSLLIVSGTLVSNYYKDLQNEEKIKIAEQKEGYESLENPYFLNNKILNGEDASGTIIIFMANKSNYYSAQRAFDEDNYDVAISYLNKINLNSFATLKNDLLGDVYFYKKDKENARISYKKALETVSKDNAYLKEAIYSKYQRVFQ